MNVQLFEPHEQVTAVYTYSVEGAAAGVHSLHRIDGGCSMSQGPPGEPSTHPAMD